MFLKVCGVTRLADALHAVEHGATAVGFVFWPPSPRHVALAQAAAIIAELRPRVTTVGVFVNESVAGIEAVAQATGIDMVQLHGDEPPAYATLLRLPVLRAVSVDDTEGTCGTWPETTTFLVDSLDRVRRGGTGVAVDWARAAPAARRWRVVLAGGLTPASVAEAIVTVRPFGVDVSSGVEAAPGLKDRDKVERFLTNARLAFEGLTLGEVR